MGFSSASASLALLVVATVCGYVLITLPRPAIPDELPALRVTDSEASAQATDDRKLARQAPSTPTALELDALLREKGESERVASEPTPVFRERAQRIAAAVAQVREHDGEQALLALRARAVEQLEAALKGTLPTEQVQGVLGSFATTLRETSVTREGVIVAPMLVVRTLYKARWNVIMSLPLLYAFSPLELRAYNGWFGLHALNGPLDARLKVLREYQRLRGGNVNEALGMLAYANGAPASAAAFYEDAQAKRPSFRLRNYALAAARAQRTLESSPPLR